MISRYEDLYDRMIQDLPGCNNNFIILKELQAAGRKFCIESEAWQEELPAVNIVANQSSYDLSDTIPYDASIKRILWVKVNGTTGHRLKQNAYDLSQDITLVFRTNHIPNTALTDGLVVKVTLVPYLFSEELAEWFMETWAEAIIGGAMYKLLTQAGKPWFNEKQAGEYLLQYRSGLCRSKSEIERKSKADSAGLEG